MLQEKIRQLNAVKEQLSTINQGQADETLKNIEDQIQAYLNELKNNIK